MTHTYDLTFKLASLVATNNNGLTIITGGV